MEDSDAFGDLSLQFFLQKIEETIGPKKGGPDPIHTPTKMPSNYKYLPETITIDFRMGDAPSERLLLHTKSSPYKAEVSDGHTYNLRHYFHKYRKMYGLDTVCPNDTDLLQFCIVAVGERRNIRLSKILETCDPSQLEWVGRTDPTMQIMMETLQEVADLSDRDMRAKRIVELMDTVLQQGLPLANRYKIFCDAVVDKCKELRSKYIYEYPDVHQACTAVLKALGALSEEEIAIEIWNTLPHKDLVVYIRLDGYPPLKNILEETPNHRRIMMRYWTRYSISTDMPYEFADVFRNYYLTPDGHCNLYDVLCNWTERDRHLLNYEE